MIFTRAAVILPAPAETVRFRAITCCSATDMWKHVKPKPCNGDLLLPSLTIHGIENIRERSIMKDKPANLKQSSRREVQPTFGNRTFTLTEMAVALLATKPLPALASTKFVMWERLCPGLSI